MNIWAAGVKDLDGKFRKGFRKKAQKGQFTNKLATT
jgi:hypothetical protein